MGASLLVSIIAILLCCNSWITDAKILQGEELLRQFEFTKLQQSKLQSWKATTANSTSSKAVRVFSKLLASNSLALRPADWTYERWLQRELAQSRRRAEAITAIGFNRASAYVTWLETKQLKPSSRLVGEFADANDPLTSSIVLAVPFSSEFYTVVEIGTPAQPSVLIIDTGSELTWLQCQPCTQCFSQTSSEIFNPANSSTYAAVPCTDAVCADVARRSCNASTCQYSIGYLDGSYTRGTVAKDVMVTDPVAGSSAAKVDGFVFGCGTAQRFTTSVGEEAGILGMNRGSLSLPVQLEVQEFAYCLPDRFTATNPGSGYIYFGETGAVEEAGETFLETPLLINPLLPDFYFIGVTGVSVGGALVPLPAGAFDIHNNGTGGTVVDSGTTVTLLADAVYGPVMAALEKTTAGLPRAPEVELEIGLGLCYNVTRGEASSAGKVPSVVFHLAGGADWELPAGNYFIPVVADRSVSCYAFFSLEGSPFSIISNTQQQNTVVVHDLANSKLSISTGANCEVGT